jgi:hypothetical protein
MREATDYSIFLAHHGQQDATSLLLSDFLSLMQRVQTSIKFNDLALAVVGLENNDLDGDLFILDDLTPRYAIANAALNVCNTVLGNAFSRLQVASKPDVSIRTSTSRRSARTVRHGLVGGLHNA